MAKQGNKKYKLSTIKKQVLAQSKEQQKYDKLFTSKENKMKQLKLINKNKTKSKAKIPYTKNLSYLIIGDGNFSFARSLIDILSNQKDVVEEKEILDSDTEEPIKEEEESPIVSDDDDDEMEEEDEEDEESDLSEAENEDSPSYVNLIATCYDTEDVLKLKYDDAKENVEFIKSLAGKVLYSVDATTLHKNKSFDDLKFDRIIFNFPHTGCGIADKERNITDQQNLITKFIASAMGLLKPGGQIHVTVKRGDPYDAWKVAAQGRTIKMIAYKCAFEFFYHLYPYYEHRRTIGFKNNVSTDQNKDIEKGAVTHVFVIRTAEEFDAKKKANLKRKKGGKSRDKDE